MTILSQPYFRIEQSALSKLESLVWPNGPVCVHCGATDRIGAVTGKGARPGLKFCCRCRKQFRVTMGTMFEGSHVPLHKWFQACFLLTASEAGISAHQLHLKLQITNKTALCMVHRLAESGRAAQRADGSAAPLGQRQLFVFPRTRWRRRVPLSEPGQTIPRDGVSNAKGQPLWPTPPAGATRQFLSFVDAARELSCSDDESRFETIVLRIARFGLNGRRPTAAALPLAAPAAEEAAVEPRHRSVLEGR
jgi:transposase-like protein